MTTEQQEAELKILRQQIEYARKKAADYRKRAAAQDAIADAKVKEAAKLGTAPLFKNIDAIPGRFQDTGPQD